MSSNCQAEEINSLYHIYMSAEVNGERRSYVIQDAILDGRGRDVNLYEQLNELWGKRAFQGLSHVDVVLARPSPVVITLRRLKQDEDVVLYRVNQAELIEGKPKVGQSNIAQERELTLTQDRESVFDPGNDTLVPSSSFDRRQTSSALSYLLKEFKE